MAKTRRRVKAARMVRGAHGREPATDGWFVLNAADSQWYRNERFGLTTRFEGKLPFPQLGFRLRVLGPDQPNCHYHGESDQEDFLVLSGRCRLLIEGREIPLKAWDFVHCPSWTEHVFVGAGKEPCVIVMTGARSSDDGVIYPRSPLALRYRAGVEVETSDPRVSYAKIPASVPCPTPRPFARKRRARATPARGRSRSR